MMPYLMMPLGLAVAGLLLILFAALVWLILWLKDRPTPDEYKAAAVEKIKKRQAEEMSGRG